MTGCLRVFQVLVLGFAPAVPLAAQRITGEIVGTVRDPSQGVITGAKVTVTNDETQLTRTMVTDESGLYRIPTLEIGRYSIEVSHSGFKTSTRQDVELHVNEVERVDFTLEVGSVTERVTVSGEAPVV